MTAARREARREARDEAHLVERRPMRPDQDRSCSITCGGHVPAPSRSPLYVGLPRLRRHQWAPVAAVVVAAVLSGSTATAQDRLPALGAGRVGAQVALGVPAGAVGYVAGGLATRWVARRFGAADGRASQLAEAGAYAGVAAFTAMPPALLGARGPGSGRYVAALGGAAAGGLGSALVVRLGRSRYGDRGGRERPCTLGCKLLGATAFVLPSVGATVGYNLSRRR